MGVNKSKQESKSSNQAFDFLRGSLGGAVDNVNIGARGISDLLSGNASGFEAFKGATGFNDRLVSGLRDVTGISAARNTFNSGATGRALMKYGTQLQNETAQNYIQNLLGLGQLGLGSAGVLGGAGQTSSSSGKSKGLTFNPPTPSGGG